MLSRERGRVRIAEVNPPELPDMSHRSFEGVFDRVLVTDNVFGRVRVSPYAYAARITHDVPSVAPTVVVSTRDRNILAIESEVRGALGNGVDSFLVVTGDSLPAIEHMSHHYEIVEHLLALQRRAGVPGFEVGMPTRFREWQYRRRIELGAQFLVAGPVMDPSTVEPSLEALERRAGDPPLLLMVAPPLSPAWIGRMESIGAVPTGRQLRDLIDQSGGPTRRRVAWEAVRSIEREATLHGCAGIVVVGLKNSTLTEELGPALGTLPVERARRAG